MNRRVLCVGLDGATFDLLDPLVERGWMPELGALQKRGCRGILRSTLPVLSGPAWVTFMTGKDPGRHGVFDFGIRRRTYLNKMFRTSMLEDLAVWELVDRAGGTSVVVNVPMTYPPQAIRGAVVTGMLTPDTNSRYTHPPELREEIQERWPGYAVDVALVGSENDPAPFLAAHVENTQRRGELGLHLLAREPWSLAVVCFVATDRIQHMLYPGIADPSSLPGDVARGLEAYYRVVDGFLGKLVRAAGDATILVVSDHGFEECRANFLLNEWLTHTGRLVKAEGASRGPMGTVVRMAKRAGLNYEALRRMTRKIGLPDISLEKAEKFSPFVHSVNWSRTRAFYGSTDGIVINLRGREPEGIVEPGEEYETLREQIRTELKALRTADGVPLLRNVLPREEVYEGRHRDEAPDLVLESNGCKIVSELLPAGSDPSRFLTKPTVWTGVHHRDGIVLAAGPGVRQGQQVEPANLADITPTMLYAMGMPVPEDMDGRVIEALFTEEHRRARPTHRSGTSRRGDGGGPAAEDEDQRKLEDQLRSLGYL